MAARLEKPDHNLGNPFWNDVVLDEFARDFTTRDDVHQPDVGYLHCAFGKREGHSPRSISNDEMATWLTSTPILKTAPEMIREAERRGGAEGDNLSAIVVRWGPETLSDEPSTTITETLDLGEFETQLDSTLTLADRKGTERDLSDDEIERAIDEIQTTIQRYRR